jgi:hypothetical protein
VTTDAPTHHRHLGPGLRVGDHGRGIVREDAGHRRQVADVTIDNTKERSNRGLVGGDAVEVAHLAIVAACRAGPRINPK